MALSFRVYGDDPYCSYRKKLTIPRLWGKLYLQTWCLPGPGCFSEIKDIWFDYCLYLLQTTNK